MRLRWRETRNDAIFLRVVTLGVETLARNWRKLGGVPGVFTFISSAPKEIRELVVKLSDHYINDCKATETLDTVAVGPLQSLAQQRFTASSGDFSI